MRWLPVALVLVGACSFQAIPEPGTPGSGSDDDGAPTGTGSGPVTGILNLASGDDALGMGDLMIEKTAVQTITIDTGNATRAPTISVTLPPETSLDIVQQNGFGLELAVLRVKALQVSSDITVTGSRPFVVVSETFQYDGTMTVTAHVDHPIPGAPISGAAALTSNTGGAVEIYAHTLIGVSGYINAGTGGDHVDLLGGGGGNPPSAPGLIILQSPDLENQGAVSASVTAEGILPGGLPGGPGGNFDGEIGVKCQTCNVGKTTPETTPY
ncbi:MAG TPA: hypothetical protein VH165_27865 [Kofleriaceae bacterium]|nr:hypothetical protein [Kofleriaceae bacterium]